MRTQIDSELSGHGINPDDKLLMIHPTFSGYSSWVIRKRQAKLRKLWAPENYGRVISKIVNQWSDASNQVKVMMVLLPGELSFGKKIATHSNGNVLLLESDPNFDRYKAMIQRADAILTPDSGPMHIASALGTKIVAFFSMKDPGDCGPYMNPEKFVVLRSEDFPYPEKGINAIDVDAVHGALVKLLSHRHPGEGRYVGPRNPGAFEGELE
jgi:ADP-heptose:LPS heptosyltransferase